jgi:hypothetical protein
MIFDFVILDLRFLSRRAIKNRKSKIKNHSRRGAKDDRTNIQLQRGAGGVARARA